MLLRRHIATERLYDGHHEGHYRHVNRVIHFIRLLARRRVDRVHFAGDGRTRTNVARDTFYGVFVLGAMLTLMVHIMGDRRLVHRFDHRDADRYFTCFNGDGQISSVRRFDRFVSEERHRSFYHRHQVGLLVRRRHTRDIDRVRQRERQLPLLVANSIRLSMNYRRALHHVPAKRVVAHVARRRNRLLVTPLVFRFR